MFIKNICLENFRSHKKFELGLEPITILIGLNGMGKTNILESIWFLAAGRSWRTSRDAELINWESDFTRIVGQVIKEEKEEKIELTLQKVENRRLAPIKQLKISGVKKRLIDLLGEMPAVLFSPEILQLVDGGPALRRRFLDIMLSQVNHKYALSLLQYQKVLRERNKLLFYINEGRSKVDELDFWDEKLVSLGSFLLEARKEAIDFFNKKLLQVYQEISGEEVKFRLNYKQTVKAGEFAQKIKENQIHEIEHTNTLIGPHRDDFEFSFAGRNLATFGSRGEYRSAILALKVLEVEFLESKGKGKPILLLDDIFSELDEKRRMHLAKIVRENQTIITTTDLDHIEKDL